MNSMGEVQKEKELLRNTHDKLEKLRNEDMNWWRNHKPPPPPPPAHDEVDPLILGDMIDEAIEHADLMTAIDEAMDHVELLTAIDEAMDHVEFISAINEAI